jgi:hypothetical protein
VRRRINKVDAAQEDIVDGLKLMGMLVWFIENPCDLLVYYYSRRRNEKRFQTIEVKTATRTGKPRKRYDQQTQNDFLAETHTPVVMTLDEAIKALEDA